jgi:hypothetical protein
VDAFDADVLIYAAVPNHPLGRHVRALFPSKPVDDALPPTGVGSALLLPELLPKPIRDGTKTEARALQWLLARLDLRPLDEATANLSVALGASYDLRAPDAVHLATAVAAGADRFLTNNRRDFSKDIVEIDVTYPADLAGR